jgi:hypothetical protein
MTLLTHLLFGRDMACPTRERRVLANGSGPQKLEAVAVDGPDGSQVAVVDRGELGHTQSLRDRHDRGIRNAERKSGVLTNKLGDARPVLRGRGLDSQFPATMESMNWPRPQVLPESARGSKPQ